jgi:hypothetical protein
LRIEHSRRHGPFDGRYPPILHTPAPVSLWRLGEERLDSQGFLARFFPGSRRHDFDALAAYESYLNDAQHSAGGFAVPALGSSSGAARIVRSDTTQVSYEDEEPPATTDTERWEGEGGASAARPRRRERSERPVRTQTG